MSDPALPGPRDWIGTAPFPWPAAGAIGVGDVFLACYFLVSVQTLRTKADKPYLRLQLQDVHGALEGRVWEMAEQIGTALRDGMYVGVRGRVEVFNGERQLKVEEVAQIRVGLDDLEYFMPRSARDPETMDRELAEWIASVEDDALRELLEHLLGAGTGIGAGFRLAPAAKFNHHAYLGGLIEHTLSIVGVCDMLARHYHPHIDRDLLIAGALLHDIGKVREIGARAGFPYTDEGKLLGHIVLGMQMIADAAADVPALSPQRLTLLQHLVASHQGRYEWQSPREPRTLEAYILHYADDLDAKMQHAIGLVGAGAAGWSGYDRSLGRDMYRHYVREGGPGSAPGPGPVAAATAAGAGAHPASGARPANSAEAGEQASPGARRKPVIPAPPPEPVGSEVDADVSPEPVGPDDAGGGAESDEEPDIDVEGERRDSPATLDLFD